MQLRVRLSSNAKVQEGERPAEEPALLLAELDELSEQFETLITRINLTNAQTLDGGETMTALLARRDCLRLKSETLRNFLNEASATVMRGMKTEVVVKSTVDVAQLQKKSDELSKQLRDLDRIQSLNWSTKLS